MSALQKQLLEIATDDSFLKFISANQKVKNSFVAFDKHMAQPIDVIRAILQAQIDYVGEKP